ncbi:MAG: Holliday junction branch migration protein RuvA [Deltaproteobacteria bacterium]|nr:Holliday junction branch migration protein RuvA [Deltaproteobacteria bacterium]
MIARIAGTLIEKVPGQVIVDVAGVGYCLLVALGTYNRLPAVEKPVQLWVTTRIRDDQLVLYGFLDREEQQMFLRLLSVSGVGAKLALNIISRVESPQLEQLLANRDVAMLAKIPGVGKKLSQRLALELGEEMAKGAVSLSGQVAAGGSGGRRQELLAAMEALGYRPADCLGVVNAAMTDNPEGTVEELIRQVLRSMHHE